VIAEFRFAEKVGGILMSASFCFGKLKIPLQASAVTKSALCIQKESSFIFTNQMHFKTSR
jgi:hypothetical protein